MRRIRLTESQLNKVIMESVKRIIKESEGNSIDTNKIMRWAEKSANELAKGSNACYYIYLGESDCKTNKMYLVIGWGGGFDESEDENPYADGQYRVCCKLAYNCDDMQCDYYLDWEMPYDEKTGDVDDTDSEYSQEHVAYLLDYWQKTYAI